METFTGGVDCKVLFVKEGVLLCVSKFGYRGRFQLRCYWQLQLQCLCGLYTLNPFVAI